MVLASAGAAQASFADKEPVSLTVYIGPSTTKFFGAVLQSGRLQATAAMVGVALDGRLAYLGWDISLGGELQVTQYVFGHRDTTFTGALGFQANEPFGWKRTSMSIYSGPSYATNPPLYGISYDNKPYLASRKKLLNYVGFEFAMQLPDSQHWDGVFRFFHRSGAFGLYNKQDDDGLALGLGVRYRF
jgi:hypothetical protein